MTTPDLGALSRWPDVPAVYGWLSLDRRGRWCLRDKPVTHAGTIAYFNRQYGRDEQGRHFVQNGPQRVFVRLDYAPWILRLLADGHLETHTGEAVDALQAAMIDEEGNLLLDTSRGLGLLDDRDLFGFLDRLRQGNGQSVDDTTLANLSPDNGLAGTLFLDWNGRRIPLQAVRRADMARRFGFIGTPTP